MTDKQHLNHPLQDANRHNQRLIRRRQETQRSATGPLVFEFDETEVPDVLCHHHCSDFLASHYTHCPSYILPTEKENFCCGQDTVELEPPPSNRTDGQILLCQSSEEQEIIKDPKNTTTICHLHQLEHKNIENLGGIPCTKYKERPATVLLLFSQMNKILQDM